MCPAGHRREGGGGGGGHAARATCQCAASSPYTISVGQHTQGRGGCSVRRCCKSGIHHRPCPGLVYRVWATPCSLDHHSCCMVTWVSWTDISMAYHHDPVRVQQRVQQQPTTSCTQHPVVDRLGLRCRGVFVGLCNMSFANRVLHHAGYYMVCKSPVTA